MMMKFKRNLKCEYGLGQIEIAPLVNVIFLILVFILLTAPFTFQSAIDIKLPKVITSDIIREENTVITITNENVIYYNNTVTTLNELKAILNKIKNIKNPILIKSDRRASMGRIIDVWDLCRSLGIEQINIATNQYKP